MTAEQQLDGKGALVTGATSGIGRAVALALAAAGARVVVSGRDKARGEEVVEEIRAAGGTAELAVGDLGAGLDEVRALAAEAERLLGGHVDVLVNNAGIYPFVPTTETDEDTFDAVYATNVKAPYFLTAALVPGMARAGGGAVVNVGTVVASGGMATAALYGSSKAALELLTRAWAAEFAGQGIRVNTVSPGPISTQGTAPVAEFLASAGAATPAGRVGVPAEVASAVLYLASPAASYVHGATISIDGGMAAAA